MVDKVKDKVIEVSMMQHQEHGMGMPALQDFTIFFRVRLFSMLKPSFISFIDIDAQNSEAEAKRAVMIGAGVLAEHQCKMYKDIWDPADIAKLAGEAFSELLADVRARSH